MVLLSVVGFVEDEEVDLNHGNKGTMEAGQENICSADDDHVLFGLLLPKFHVFKVLRCAVKSGDVTVQVTLEDFILLICQRNLVNLQWHIS